MQERCDAGRERRAWLWVGFWTLIIFTSIPLARRIREVVTERAGRGTFTVIVLVCLGLALTASAAYVAAHRRRFPPRRLIWLLPVGAVYTVYTLHLKSAPEEALHFLEYGVLGILLFRAFRCRMPDAVVYVCAILAGAIIGTVDESIQWVTPKRYWDWRDIWLNGVSCALIQIAIAGTFARPLTRRVSPRSVCVACRLAMALTLVFALCLLNTPAAVDVYASPIPWLRFLQYNPSVMAEYGYRHVDPEHGIFVSRLSPEHLRGEDARRGAEIAALLDQWRNADRYKEFLVTYPGHRYPIAHETRVRMFRRDSRLALLKKHPLDEAKRREHATVVYREDALMRRHFSNTLYSSTYALSPELIALLRPYVGVAPYRSSVSLHLLTRFSQKQILAILGLIVLILAFVHRLAARSAPWRRT